jgi:hypothetical protein
LKAARENNSITMTADFSSDNTKTRRQNDDTVKALKEKKNLSGQTWWHTPISPALRRLRQEDYESEASLDA